MLGPFGLAPMPSPGAKSPPAQNARPAPVRINTRNSRSSAKSRLNRASSACIGPFTAFSRSGRFSVTTAMPSPRRSICIVW
jgi:hypothetical protein